MTLAELTELYQRRREERLPRLERFFCGESNYLIVQRPGYELWERCNSVAEIVENNRRHLESWLAMQWSDELPHLQPWIGTGIYANAFGCEYLWREDNAPDSHVLYHSIEEVRGLPYPDYRRSPVMAICLETIDALNEEFQGRFPIALTDTQSPVDTATLVLDATEFFVACYTHEEVVFQFLKTITDLVIEFSQVQRQRIGEERVSRPGHVMPSLTTLRGVTLSDDNLAVSSPGLNEKYSLSCNQRIAEALGGVAIHSCGVWDHTMRKLPGHDVVGIDCSVHRDWDPTPNAPEAVRAAMQDSGIVIKARVSGHIEEALPALERLAGPGIRLIVDILRLEPDDRRYEQTARHNYERAFAKLQELYRE
jgi:hypothetical protein